MSAIIDRDTRSIVSKNGSLSVTIPAKWTNFLNVSQYDEVEVALMDGKHGFFFAVWAEDQKTMEDIKEENSGVL